MTSGSRKRKTVKREVFVATDDIRKKYNTEEVMKELSVKKSDNKRFIDFVKKINESE